MLQLSEGTMSFEKNANQVAEETAYTHLSFCAPYLELIEEMTLKEFLLFHQRFKPFLNGFDLTSIISAIGLEAAAGKQIRYYSSGMKQRVKLAQSILFDTSVVLLDEPCSNLDTKGIDLYHSLIANYCQGRLVLVCSNDPVEYRFCKEVVSIMDLKK